MLPSPLQENNFLYYGLYEVYVVDWSSGAKQILQTGEGKIHEISRENVRPDTFSMKPEVPLSRLFNIVWLVQESWPNFPQMYMYNLSHSGN